MEIKPKESAKFDIVSLGEVMLRLDPGEDRIRTAAHLGCGKVAENTMSPAASENVSGSAPGL